MAVHRSCIHANNMKDHKFKLMVEISQYILRQKCKKIEPFKLLPSLKNIHVYSMSGRFTYNHEILFIHLPWF